MDVGDRRTRPEGGRDFDRLFHAVVQVNDYLQSVSSETRTRGVTGRDVRAGVKIQ